MNNKNYEIVINHKDDEKNLEITNENEYIMGRKIYFKIPILWKVVSISYCQIFQLIFGKKFNIYLFLKESNTIF